MVSALRVLFFSFAFLIIWIGSEGLAQETLGRGVSQGTIVPLTTRGFQVRISDDARWLELDPLTAGFAKIRILDGDQMAVVPSLTFALRVPRPSQIPSGVAAIRVPGLNGASQVIRFFNQVIEGRIGVPRFPYELELDLLDVNEKAMGQVKVIIESVNGHFYVNNNCLEKNIGLMNPAYVPRGAVFVACEPDDETQLALLYSGAKKISWDPAIEGDQRPLGNMALIVRRRGPEEPRFEFEAILGDGSSEAFELQMLRESNGWRSAWGRPLPKREWEFELGAYHMNLSRTQLPGGDFQASTDGIEQRGLKGRVDWIHHIREGKADFRIGAFSFLAPFWRDRDGTVTWILGADFQGQWVIPINQNRWNLKLGLGLRYENLMQTGAWDLQNLLGPLASFQLSYRRSKVADELFYITSYSPLQQWGRRYFFNQYYWSHAVGYMFHRSRNYSLGWSFKYEAHQIGNHDRGYEVGTYSLNTMIRY